MNSKHLAACALLSVPLHGMAQDRCHLPEVDDHRFLSALHARLTSCGTNYITHRLNRRNSNGTYRVKTEILFEVGELRYSVTLGSKGRDPEIVIRNGKRRILKFRLGHDNAKTCDNVEYMEIYKEGAHKLPKGFKNISYTFDIDNSKGEPKLEKENIEKPFKYTNATFNTHIPLTDATEVGEFVGRICRGLLGAAREEMGQLDLIPRSN